MKQKQKTTSEETSQYDGGEGGGADNAMQLSRPIAALAVRITVTGQAMVNLC